MEDDLNGGSTPKPPGFCA